MSCPSCKKYLSFLSGSSWNFGKLEVLLAEKDVTTCKNTSWKSNPKQSLKDNPMGYELFVCTKFSGGNARLRAIFRATFERVGPMTGISDNELVPMGECVWKTLQSGPDAHLLMFTLWSKRQSFIAVNVVAGPKQNKIVNQGSLATRFFFSWGLCLSWATVPFTKNSGQKCFRGHFLGLLTKLEAWVMLSEMFC